MTILGLPSTLVDPAASAGLAVRAWRNGEGVAATMTFPANGLYTFAFYGRQDFYGAGDGIHARVSLLLDGVPAGGAFVTNTAGYVSYSIVTTVSAGQHTFGLVFDNDAWGGSSSTDRNAYFDKVSVSFSAPTPTPTATPTSTPTSTPSATPTPTPVGPDTTPPSVSITSPAWAAAVSGDLPSGVNTGASALDQTEPQRTWVRRFTSLFASLLNYALARTGTAWFIVQ